MSGVCHDRSPGWQGLAAAARTGWIMGGFQRWIGALLLTCWAAPLAAGPCADPGFTVVAEDAALGARLCALAPEIRDDLAACGLQQARPLTIEVVPETAHRLGRCLAWFDCDRDTIRLADPARYGDLLDAANPYAALPADVLLEAALTHEMAHALAGQGAGDSPLALVDQEYIAAALELERMATEWRAVLIAAAPAPLPPAPGLIDIWIYGLEPRRFATNAWQHFSLPENGCALIRRVVAGETTLATGR
jgi:hypothetical protein